eukprot:CAMPEP_0173432286 /NCGR_PEP_ID=MMETSP1357-20121228/10130_1 /TAXON_ID=77926 /ORGANISM="Hemiselmis rufescens, Strain PCC563" /LENGTH=580 /DNA_ID=CAMNT_0014396861 /DNA_START=6 /DNA_END=1748 /DNA_ORIENTATION=+
MSSFHLPDRLRKRLGPSRGALWPPALESTGCSVREGEMRTWFVRGCGLAFVVVGAVVANLKAMDIAASFKTNALLSGFSSLDAEMFGVSTQLLTLSNSSSQGFRVERSYERIPQNFSKQDIQVRVEATPASESRHAPSSTARDHEKWFMSPEEEAREVGMSKTGSWALEEGRKRDAKRVVPLSQPIGMRNRTFQTFPSLSKLASILSSPALCVHWKEIDGYGSPCGYLKKKLQYTWVKDGIKRTCDDPYDAPYDVRRMRKCSSVFNGSQEVAYFTGPTWIQARNAHIPHFADAVALGSNWLARNTNRSFAQTLVETSETLVSGSGDTACVSFDKYVPGFFAPSGSPLAETIQYYLLRGLATGIVTAWNVKPGKIVCFGEPIGYSLNNPDANVNQEMWRDPQTCSSFRTKMIQSLGLNVLSTRRGFNVLLVNRMCCGRVVRNLFNLPQHHSVQGLGMNFSMAWPGKGVLRSSRAQLTAFLETDALVLHHGAAVFFGMFVRGGGLVVEIFNYKVVCRCCFLGLIKKCGKDHVQLQNEKGRSYPENQCNGVNDKRDGTDDGDVDLGKLGKILSEKFGPGTVRQ